MMKLNQTFAIWGVAAALCLSTGSLLAQNDNGGDRQGGFGRGNFDPAQFQQRIMDNIRDQLGFTNDTDWSAVQPLVQKVMDARRDMAGAGMRMMFRRPGGDNQDRPNRGGFFGGQPSPEAEALQQAIDGHVPDAQLQQALDRYRASMKQKQAQLEQAQDNLRKVLTIRQEAQATLLGLLQ
ncbi:MAG TPA: hypothetical protein VMA35_09965 [Candidatus Sulfopaludibacter sp.]|nr:hypothetical protein [Candidatus Sulfopaludibacter sp.]